LAEALLTFAILLAVVLLPVLVNSSLTVVVMLLVCAGDPATNTLLDCPFCHRVLLTLEAKVTLADNMYSTQLGP
jgi:hypothetical protein